MRAKGVFGPSRAGATRNWITAQLRYPSANFLIGAPAPPAHPPPPTATPSGPSRGRIWPAAPCAPWWPMAGTQRTSTTGKASSSAPSTPTASPHSTPTTPAASATSPCGYQPQRPNRLRRPRPYQPHHLRLRHQGLGRPTYPRGHHHRVLVAGRRRHSAGRLHPGAKRGRPPCLDHFLWRQLPPEDSISRHPRRLVAGEVHRPRPDLYRHRLPLRSHPLHLSNLKSWISNSRSDVFLRRPRQGRGHHGAHSILGPPRYPLRPPPITPTARRTTQKLRIRRSPGDPSPQRASRTSAVCSSAPPPRCQRGLTHLRPRASSSPSQTYPLAYSYDSQGRMTVMTTRQDFAGDTSKSPHLPPRRRDRSEILDISPVVTKMRAL